MAAERRSRSIADALARELPEDWLHPTQPVQNLTRTADGIAAATTTGEVFHPTRAVLALPPRTASSLTCAPAFSTGVLQAMTANPKWKAGQAKAVVV